MPLRLDAVERSSIEGDVKCDMHSMNLMLGLNELRLSGQLLDVTLLAEKKPFQVIFFSLKGNSSDPKTTSLCLISSKIPITRRR